jgi:1,4-dihydroxy-2-naphthoate octaprenyltransferase
MSASRRPRLGHARRVEGTRELANFSAFCKKPFAADAARGWRTAAVRYGPRRVADQRAGDIYVALSAFAYLAPFFFWRVLGFTAWVILPILTLPLAFALGCTICARDDPGALGPMTGRASLLSCAYAALLAIGLAIE